MNSLSASLQVKDNLSPMLNHIAGAADAFQKNFQRLQNTAAAGINSASWAATEHGIICSSSAIKEYNRNLEETRQKAAKPIVPNIEEQTVPEWKRVSTPEVVRSSGAKRFYTEIQLADQAARKLYQSQMAISQKAQRMRIVPPEMLNDVAAVCNRMQSLQNKVIRLNQIPMDLRTDSVNNDIEVLRGSLADIEKIQNHLNDSISKMDFSAINDAYQQINNIADTAERNIRDNLQVQPPDKPEGGQNFLEGIAEFGNKAVPIIKTAAKDMTAAMYDAAVQLEATEARYQSVFWGMTNEADQFIKSFQSLTPATTAEARDMAMGIQELLRPMGIQREAATQMTGEYMHLIGALANFNSYTKTAGDVAWVFQSAIAGEYEALKELGIHLDETMVSQQAVSMGLAQNTSAVSNAAKAQAVLALAYGQSQNALVSYNQASLSTGNRMEVVKKGFQDAFAQAGQAILPHITNLLMQIQARMPQIAAGLTIFAGIFGSFLDVCSGAFHILMDIGAVVVDNWSAIGPVIAGITAALITYKGIVIALNTVQAISNGLQAIAATNAAIKAGAESAGAVATGVATAAQVGLNTALLACPLTWIILAIVAVIAAIVVWIQHVGGIKVAWLMVVNAVLTAADLLKLGFTMRVNNIRDSIDYMILAFESLKVGILNALGKIKVKGLSILQDFINGAIGMINDFINAVNSITGTSISTINEVSFAATVAEEEEARQQQRENDLSALKTRQNMNKGIREMQQNIQTINLKNDMARRQAEIDQLKRAGNEKQIPTLDVSKFAGGGNDGTLSDIGNNTGGTAANTAAMADSMGIMEEDLKYMRDAAEQEIINRFTLAELKLDVNNNNTLTTKNDFEEMTRQMANYTGEFLAVAAEGGYF